MDEQHKATGVVDPLTLTAAPPPRKPFDPANLLDGRLPPPLLDMAGPTVEVIEAFDPADHLGQRGQRGAFDLGAFKPLLATIGGVEMVTVPAAHYAELLTALAVSQTGAEVMPLDLEPERGTTEPESGEAVAVIRDPAETSEAHGAALDDGHATEAHGAASDAGKRRRHPRGAGSTLEVP